MSTVHSTSSQGLKPKGAPKDSMELVRSESSKGDSRSFHGDSHQRFPRLSSGDQLFYLTSIAWGLRRTLIREQKGYTEILFRIPARRTFRRTSIFGVMFEPDKRGWVGAFEDSFCHTEYSKKPAHRYLDLGFKAIYAKAIKDFYRKGLSGRPDAVQAHVNEAIGRFEALNDSTNTTKSAAVAVSLAARYRYLYDRIKHIRVHRGAFNSEIEEIVPPKKAKLFLRNETVDNVYDIFYGNVLNPRDLTMKIVRWELRRKGLKFKRKRTEEYIALGGKILGSLGRAGRATFDQAGRSRISIPKVMPKGLKPPKRQANATR
jgi:hypothetical protein